MKYLALLILLTITGNNFTGDVSEFNKVKREAEFAFNGEDYSTAADKYRFLIDSLKYDDDNARLNLAHSLYKMEEIETSKAMYEQLSSSSNREVNSIANQQLGIFESRGKNLQKSLDYFKKSLKANPLNEESRYNYELVKKKIDENNQNQDQENQDQKDQENKDEQEEKEQNKENQQDQNKENQKEQEKNNKSEQDKEQQQERKIRKSKRKIRKPKSKRKKRMLKKNLLKKNQKNRNRKKSSRRILSLAKPVSMKKIFQKKWQK